MTYSGESAQQWWFEPDTLSVVSGVTTLTLANLFKKHSVAYIQGVSKKCKIIFESLYLWL